MGITFGFLYLNKFGFPIIPPFNVLICYLTSLTWHNPRPVGRGQTGTVGHLGWCCVGRHDADLLEVGRLVQQARAASGRGGLRVRGLSPARDALHQTHAGGLGVVVVAVDGAVGGAVGNCGGDGGKGGGDGVGGGGGSGVGDRRRFLATTSTSRVFHEFGHLN